MVSVTSVASFVYPSIQLPTHSFIPLANIVSSHFVRIGGATVDETDKFLPFWSS